MANKQHGGRRDPPGGRPRLTETPTIAKTITLTQADLDYLLTINRNLSQAIRTLIERQRAT